MQRLASFSDLLAFINRHGVPVRQAGTAVAPNEHTGEYTAWFANGSKLRIVVDYEPDYSELTPGSGWTVSMWGEEAAGC